MFLAQLLDLCAVRRGMVVLVDFVRREVAHVDVGGQAGLEWCADITELLEDDTLEEGVGADFGATGGAVRGAEALGSVAEKPGREVLEEKV